MGPALMGHAIIGRALMGQALIGRALLGQALMGRALMGRGLMGQALMAPLGQVFFFVSASPWHKAINVSSTSIYIRGAWFGAFGGQ